MTTLEKAIIGGTHLCGHGHMAVMCRICPAEKERDEAKAEIKRISSALLDPSDEVVAYSLAAMIGTLWAAGWAETELRKIPKGALQTAFEEGLRAAGVKITGKD
jgi:hypothetical protein